MTCVLGKKRKEKKKREIEHCFSPWWNPLWLTGLKIPTNKLTIQKAFTLLTKCHLIKPDCLSWPLREFALFWPNVTPSGHIYNVCLGHFQELVHFWNVIGLLLSYAIWVVRGGSSLQRSRYVPTILISLMSYLYYYFYSMLILQYLFQVSSCHQVKGGESSVRWWNFCESVA